MLLTAPSCALRGSRTAVRRQALLLTTAVFIVLSPMTAKSQSVDLPSVSVGQGYPQPTAQADEDADADVANQSAIRDSRADTDGSASYTSSAVSTGGKEPLSRRDVPHSVSVVTRQQMNDQNMNTVWDALAFVPGVTVVSNDQAQGQYHARGFALNVMTDGMPSYNGLSGYQQFDLAIYDRVEVLRGPAGLFMGSGQPSGVVNLVKKRPRKEAAVGGSASYGSWDNKSADIDLSTPLNESGTLRARGVIAGRDRGFYYDRGYEEKWIGYGIVEYDLTPRTLVTVAAVTQQYDGSTFMGNPAFTDGRFIDLPRSSNVYPDWARGAWDTQEYSASLEHRFTNDWRFKVSAARRDQDFHFNDAFPRAGVDPATMTTEYSQREVYDTYQRDVVDTYLSGPVRLFGLTHTLLVGYNYERFTTDSARGDGPSVPDVSILDPNASLPHIFIPLTRGSENLVEQSGFYGQARIKLAEPLTVVLGARLSTFDAKSRTAPPSVAGPWVQGAHAKGEFTPYGGVVLDLTDEISVYGSYADIFAPQTQRTWPSGTLPPRVGEQFEIGVKGEFFGGRLNTSLAYFDIKDTNRAYADLDNPGYFVALGEMQSRGIDAEVSGEVLPGLSVMAGYTYLHTEFLKDANNQGLPVSGWYPEHLFKLWAHYRFQGPALERWSVGAGILAQSETGNAIRNAQRIQPAYAVVNALVGYRFDENIEATLSVNNVFDEAYYTRLGGLNTYNTFGEPRNVMFTLRRAMN